MDSCFLDFWNLPIPKERKSKEKHFPTLRSRVKTKTAKQRKALKKEKSLERIRSESGAAI